MFAIHGFKDRKRCVCVKGLVFEWIAVFLQSLFSPQGTRGRTQGSQTCVPCVLPRVPCGEKKHNKVVAAEVSDTTLPA